MAESSIRDMLARIDERTKNMDERTKCIPTLCSAHSEAIDTLKKNVDSLWGRYNWAVGIAILSLIGLVTTLLVK